MKFLGGFQLFGGGGGFQHFLGGVYPTLGGFEASKPPGKSVHESICFVAKNDIPHAVKSKNTKYVLNWSDARILLAYQK